MSDSKENVDVLKMKRGLLVNKLKLILRNLVLTKQKRLNLRSGIIIYYKVY